MNELFSLWRTSNPIAQWLELSTEREQNAALGGLSPTAAPEQATVTLFPAAGKKFVSTQPADIGVFFSPAGLPASITQWTEERVGVQVPNLAFDGHVYFGYILTESALKQLLSSIQDWRQWLGSNWDETYLKFYVQGLVRRPYCAGEEANHFRVTRPPQIVSFAAFADNGGMILREQDLPQAVLLRWECLDRSATATVRVVIDGQPYQEGLPLQGSLPLTAPVTGTIRLEAQNVYGVRGQDLSLVPPVVFGGF